MFLARLIERNPQLAAAAVRLHQQGEVLANTYLLDLDQFSANAAVIADAAQAAGLTSYFMAKQYGRNPEASRAVVSAIPSAVCVDLQDMEAHSRNNIPIGHVGHLVQPHRGAEQAVIEAHPEVVTIFDDNHARRLSAAAESSGRTIDVLLRVHAPGDHFYFGHGGGFPLADIEAAAGRLQQLPALRVAGVTTFPCLLASPEQRTIEQTPNLMTLREAATRLRAAGIEVRQVNAPGTTSALTMTTLAAAGTTHVEPGNALHGTTPLHLFDPAAPEVPAIAYVSEVSHLDGENAYAYAAGYYADKVLGDYQLTALSGRDDHALDRVFRVDTAPAGAIHYYCILRDAARHGVAAGDSVVFCFRPQAFVTRGRTQAVAGLHSASRITVHDRHDVEGNKVSGVG